MTQMEESYQSIFPGKFREATRMLCLSKISGLLHTNNLIMQHDLNINHSCSMDENCYFED